VLEKISFDGNVLITPGILTVTLERPNDYKLANITYKFSINTANSISNNSRIYINFTNEWNLYDPKCSVLRGITPVNNSND